MFIVYSKDNCPACENAKKMLHEQGKEYKVVKLVQDGAVGDNEINRADFIDKFPGIRVVPYIQTPTNTYLKSLNELVSYLK